MPLQVDLERLRLGEGRPRCGSSRSWGTSAARRRCGSRTTAPTAASAATRRESSSGCSPTPAAAASARSSPAGRWAPTTAWPPRCSPAGSGCGRCSCWCLSPRRSTSAASSSGCAPSGAEIHLAHGVARAYALAASLMLRRASPPVNLPYFLRPGGSVPLGCVGYVEAAIELSEQVEAGELPEPSHIVVPLGSGGTAAGLLAGLKLAGLRSRLVCVLVNDLIRVDERTVARLAGRTLRLLRKRGASVGEVEVAAADLTLERDWLGAATDTRRRRRSGHGRSSASARRWCWSRSTRRRPRRRCWSSTAAAPSAPGRCSTGTPTAAPEDA